MKNKLLVKLTKLMSFGLVFTLLTAVPAYAADDTHTAGSSMRESAHSDDEYTEDPAKDPYGIMPIDLLSGGWKQNSTGWWYEYSIDGYREGEKGNGEARYWPKSTWRQISTDPYGNPGKKWYWFNKSGYWVDDNTHEAGSLKGVDVSKWNGTIDWQAVKNDGFQFAFIRIGHGDHVIDPCFKQNITDANAAGIQTGVYYYSTATTEAKSREDAQFVIANLSGYRVSYPVAIDLEDKVQENLSKTQVAKIAKAFCDEIRAAGYTPMLYVNEDWYRNHIDASLLNGVEMWIAAWNNKYSTNISRNVWQCTDNGRVAGIKDSKGAVDIDFGYTDYSQIITPRTGAVSSYHPTTGSWRKNSTGYWFKYAAGGYPASKWELINGKWYWFNKSGYMETGWVKTGGKWYYLNSSGAMTTGWQKVKGKWYYMNDSGAMLTGWQLVNSKWYYMKGSGAMTTGWQKVKGKWYYMNKSGAMLTGWQKIGGKWYYLKSSGAMATGWQQIEGKWYYLRGSGAMASNTWIGKYYVNRSGVWTKTK